MATRFFTREEFNTFFVREITQALAVYDRMMKGGFKENALSTFDFDFISDSKEKLTLLGKFFEDHYGYHLREIVQKEYWTLSGDAIELPYDKDNLLFWVMDLYCKGYEYDCRLMGYGTINDPAQQQFLSLDKDMEREYYHKGIQAINKRNFGAAIIYFSVALQINPGNAEAWHARGYAKDEIHLWKAARKDYDMAIEKKPDFVDALVIRATNKDEAREYESAITDYNKAIEIDPDNATAWFNRGNTKRNMGDRKGACEDWQKARELGAVYADDRINAECR